jgi:putative transposase
MIDREHDLPLAKQCRILKLSRSSQYYQPVPVSDIDLRLMRAIDEIHLKRPFFGSRRIRDSLNDLGHAVGRDHVRTLMQKMGIEALYRKPNLSRANRAHKVYPYLLRDLKIERANQVWATDITYIPMAKGFAYLIAVMDWHSRRVLSWRLSNTLDTSFCVEALEEAIRRYGRPEIFNTDQGCQFTSAEFTGVLQANGIQISMDGKGRWIDNVFVERLWWSLKYEDVYLRAYDSMSEARQRIGTWFEFYNTQRRHQNLNRQTPDQMYWATLPVLELAA